MKEMFIPDFIPNFKPNLKKNKNTENEKLLEQDDIAKNMEETIQLIQNVEKQDSNSIMRNKIFNKIKSAGRALKISKFNANIDNEYIKDKNKTEIKDYFEEDEEEEENEDINQDNNKNNNNLLKEKIKMNLLII